MTNRICYAVALVAVIVGVGATFLPLADDCGIPWQTIFGDNYMGCTEAARRRLLVVGVATATVALSALGVAYVFCGRGDDH